MRTHHAVAVVVVLILGLGAKQFFFPPQDAEASIRADQAVSLNVLQMHRDMDMKNLPVQRVHDMALVFDAD
jgi:hypothetical protein